MAKIERFEDLNVWQESRVLAQQVYKSVIKRKDIDDYPLKNQINKSSGSVMDNIAEGFDRKGNKEFRQFLTISHGSNGEVKSQLYRAFDRGYITKEQFEDMTTKCVNISKMITGLTKYLNKTEYSGSKFKVEEPGLDYGLNNIEH